MLFTSRCSRTRKGLPVGTVLPFVGATIDKRCAVPIVAREAIMETAAATVFMNIVVLQ